MISSFANIVAKMAQPGPQQSIRVTSSGPGNTPLHPPTYLTSRDSNAAPDYEPKTTDVLTAAFSTDPVMTYFLNNLPAAKRPGYLRLMFHLIFHMAGRKGGEFYQATSVTETTASSTEPGFHCAAVIMPPGKEVVPSSLADYAAYVRRGMLRMLMVMQLSGFLKPLVEYPALAEKAKAAVFGPGEKYYYVQMMGTEAAYRGRGLCPAILEEVKAKAQKEGIPVWLEATTAASAKVYRKCGWKDVNEDVELVLGKGMADASGEAKKDGEGVRIYSMCWWPEGYVRKGDGKKELRH